MTKKITDSARCPECEESLGRPEKVVEQHGERYTLYDCASCDGNWYRMHGN